MDAFSLKTAAEMAAEILPYALLATDVAHAYRSVFVTVTTASSLILGIVVATANDAFELSPAKIQAVTAHDRYRYTLAKLDLFLLPAVACVTAPWMRYALGSTVILLFVFVCTGRIDRQLGGRPDHPLISYAAVLLFVAAAAIASAAGFGTVEEGESRWHTETGWSTVPIAGIFLLAATKQTRAGRKHRMSAYTGGTAVVLLTVGLSNYAFQPGNGRGMPFASQAVVEDTASDVCRSLLYAALCMSVYLQSCPIPHADKEPERIRRIETDLVAIAWAAIIAVPLVALNQAVVFTVFACLVRALRLLTVYKTRGDGSVKILHGCES